MIIFPQGMQPSCTHMQPPMFKEWLYATAAISGIVIAFMIAKERGEHL